METKRGFVCEECGYIARVRGTRYVADQEHRMTVHCGECQELMDIVVARNTGEEWAPLPMECPQASFHHLQPWMAKGRCPRCAGRMNDAGTPDSPPAAPEAT